MKLSKRCRMILPCISQTQFPMSSTIVSDIGRIRLTNPIGLILPIIPIVRAIGIDSLFGGEGNNLVVALSFFCMNEIGAVRVVAIFLITGFHLSLLQSWEACGALFDYCGNIGNFLFFLVSGYALSDCGKIQFRQWLIRRYSKIFPSVWLFYFICWCFGIYKSYTLREVLLLDKYWFLNAIIFFYPVYYLCVGIFRRRIILCCACVCVAYFGVFFAQPHETYIMQGGRYFIRWYPYFFAMLLGAQLPRREEFSPYRVLLLIFFVIFLVLFHGVLLDFAMDFSSERWLQIFSPPIACLSSVLVFKLIQIFSGGIAKDKAKALHFISSITLEIYVVQFVVIAFFMRCRFDGKSVAAAVTIFVAATILKCLKTKVLRIC